VRGKRGATSQSEISQPISKKSKVFSMASSSFFLCLFVLLNCSSSFCNATAVDPHHMKAVYGNEPAKTEEVKECTQLAKVQKHAPAFTADSVINGEFKTITLNDFKGKYLVIFFYPLDFTFVCPTEITAFSDRVDEFRNINCEVLAISVDSKFSHLAWTNTPRKQGGLGKMKIPLVSDLTKQISKDYGVLLEDGEDAGVSLRGLFILNEKGIIRHISINDLPVGRNVDETLRLVQAFQHTDKHGEVCPSGWKPGDATMFADPTKSKEYFKKVLEA